ncbi:hypothetical protein OMDBNIEC_00066 [Salmonella phage STP-SP5]|nr:hypothetical protein OMDBNIEC_00066 [Salmonella phage STP-SP5]
MTKIAATMFLLATLVFSGIYSCALIFETVLPVRFIGSVGLCVCLTCFVLCIIIIQEERKIK